MNFSPALELPTTVRYVVDRIALLQPKVTFLISAEGRQVVTFKEFQLHAKNLYVELRQLGLTQGDKIAFLMDNSVPAAELFLGTMYGGFVAVPLNVRAGVAQLSYMLEHSDANIVFVEDKYRSMLAEVMEDVEREVRAISIAADKFTRSTESSIVDPLPVLQAEDPALLIYSSGTTGQPKGAVHTHKSILAHGSNSILAHKLTSEDRSLLVLPLYHINAECVTLIPTLMSGGSVVIPHGFRVSEFWDWLDDYRCTWSAVVPTIIGQLLDWKDPKANSRAACFERIRFLRSSSAPLSPALHREFLDKFKLPLIQAMGSSEGGNVFSNPVPPGVNKIGSPGLPWGFDIRIIGRADEDLPTGEPGELLIRGEGMMQGYYKDPAGTAAALDTDRWLHTGDLAYQDEDGYVFVVGRSKELIIKGGMNIAPKQIDEVLESHPAVLEAAAVGVPDRYVGEEVVAFAVLRESTHCDESELLAFCESRLGHFKTPARIQFVRDLPKGPSGKVQRLKLQEELAERSLSPAASGAPNHPAAPDRGSASPTMLEDVIAEVWADLLKAKSIDPQENFFSLGGHSLLAIQCLARLRDKLPVRMSITDFFENPTVAEQAALIRRRVALAAGSPVQANAGWREDLSHGPAAPIAEETIPARDRSLSCPLSLNQRRLWFMSQAVGGEPVYNEAEAVRLRGKLNVIVLEKALNAIIERRENLRTSIRMLDNEPVAFVHDRWRLKVKQIDLSALTPAEREADAARLLIDEPRLSYRLDAEPSIRATLVRLGPTEHVFILMMHHIICDWASMGNFWRDLSALYRAGLRGQPLELPAPPIQHGDYAVWQQDLSRHGAFSEDLAYWVQKLRGAPALIELPADRPRPAVYSYRGARRRFQIPTSLTQTLRECSRREKVSLFTIFAAALNVLLYRYTGQDDVVLGVPLSERDRPELQTMIGFLLHTHALRTRLSGDMRFRDLLLRVQKDSLDLYVHRSPPFDQVVNAVQPARSLSYSPLFQVMLNWRDRDQLLSFIGLEGLEVESVLAESRTAKFDLTLMLTDGDESIDLEVEYSTDLFDEDRIERLVGHFNTLLEVAAADPTRRVSELPLLTDGERWQLLIDWNRTESPYPKDRCLHQLFEEQVERIPDTAAVVFEERQLTYRELNERASQLARYLQELGVGPDKLVAICLERSLEMVVGLLGILKAGGAYVPLDPTYPRERLAHMLRDSDALLLLTQERLRAQFDTESFNFSIVCVDADRGAITGPLNRSPMCVAGPENLAYVIYTSGSTGEPKGVEIRHRSLVNVLTAMARELNFAQNDKLLAVTTISFDIAGLELFLPLISGGQVEVAPTSELRDGFALRRRVERSEATVIQATPATWSMLIETGWTGGRDLRALCGGEAITSALAEGLAGRAEKVWNVYGPTETTIWSSFDRIEPGQPITIGRPIANTQVYVVDKGGEPVPIGVSGELLIGGDGVARGYLRRPKLTAEKFIPDPFRSEPGASLYRTGDLVRRLADGTIEWIGRLDHQVKVRGFRIELGEIESVLATHPAVREAVVLAREDTPGDARIVAYLKMEEGSAPGDSNLRDLLRARLPEYMIPSAFVVLDRFPLTPNGKVDRKAFKPALDMKRVSAGYLGPSTHFESVLCRIWSKRLNLERVGTQDNFFEVGGHSLLAVRVVGEINKTLNVRLNALAIFQNNTVGQLAKLLDQQRHEKSRLVLLRPGTTDSPVYIIGTEPTQYRIAQLIGGGRAVFGIDTVEWEHAVKAADLASLPTIEQLGAICADALYAHAGTSPCTILGHCFWGRIAFETAHALKSRGGNITVVILLDTFVSTSVGLTRGTLRESLRSIRLDTTSRTSSRNFIHRLRTASSNTLRLLRWLLSQVPRVVKGRFSVIKRRVLVGPQLSSYLYENGMPIEQEVVSRMIRMVGRSFYPRPLDAPGVIIRAKSPAETAPGYDFSNGWDGLFVRGLDVLDATADHNSLTGDDHIAEIARLIDAALERHGVAGAGRSGDEFVETRAANFRHVQAAGGNIVQDSGGQADCPVR